MSSHAELRSFLDSPEAAVEKLAEIAAAGRVIRDMRREAGLPDKVAWSLNDVTTALSGYGGKAMDWARANPTAAGGVLGAGAGALGGAALGAGSGLFGQRRKKNILGNALTGGLAGGAAGLGLGALAGSHADSLGSLAKQYLPGMFGGAGGGAGAIPGDKVTPGGGTPPPTPQQIEEASRRMSKAVSEQPVARGVHTGVDTIGRSIWDFAKRNQLISAIAAGDLAASGGSMADAAANASGQPRISASPADFQAGFKKLQQEDAWKKLLPGYLNDDKMTALGGLTGDKKKIHEFLLKAIAGNTQDLPIPAAVDTERWTKTIEGLRNQMSKLDPSKATAAIESTGTQYDLLRNKLTELEQMNPDAMDEIARIRKALFSSGSAVSNAAERIPDVGPQVQSIEELIASLKGKPPMKSIAISPSDVGHVSRAAIPSDRWVGSVRSPVTIPQSGRWYDPRTWQLRSPLTEATGADALARAGYMLDAEKNVIPKPGIPSSILRFVGKNRRWLGGPTGTTGRLLARGGLYGLPILADLYMRGQQQHQLGQEAANTYQKLLPQEQPQQ